MELTNKTKKFTVVRGLVWLQNTRLTYQNQLYFYTLAKKRKVKTFIIAAKYQTLRK